MRTLVLLIAMVLGASALAGQGGSGGNVEGSTPEQVRMAISSIEAYSSKFWGEEYSYSLINTYVHGDNEFHLAIERIFGPPELISKSKTTPQHSELNSRIMDFVNDPALIQPRKNGPCHGGELESDRDASTTKKRGTPICFSVERLTRIPITTLQNEIVALFFHELAHQYGYEENIARKIQNLVLERLSFAPIAEAIDKFAATADAARRTGKYESICSEVGYIAGLIAASSLRPNYGLEVISEADYMALTRPGDNIFAHPLNYGVPPALLGREIMRYGCQAERADLDFIAVGLKIINSLLTNQ